MSKSPDDLRATLAHHDAAINQLSGRVSKVETAVAAGFSKATDNFNDLKGMLQKTDAQRGPGLSEVMKVVATGGAIVGMSATAITMLVTSFVTPELTGIKGTTSVLAKDHEARIEYERQELTKYRDKRRQEVDERLNEMAKNLEVLKERFGWQAKVSR